MKDFLGRRGAFFLLAIIGVALLMGCASGTKTVPVLPSPPLTGGPVASLVMNSTDRTSLLRQAEAALSRPPDPLRTVHVEGVLPTLPNYQRAAQARKDWRVIPLLADAYALSREPRYREGYARYLTAWLAVYEISGNPIDETALDGWLLAYRSAGAALPPELALRMREFACALAGRYTQPPPAGRESSINNWQSHRAKLAVMGAQVCGRPELIGRAEAVFVAQIRNNLLPNGETIDFVQRDAVHYVLYSVEPLLEAALFAQQQGRLLFATVGPAGQSLDRSLTWLSAYARGEKTHEEFVRSRVRFDAERAAAGVAGFSGPFSPAKARWAFWLAAQLDRKWGDLSTALGIPGAAQRAPWLTRLPPQVPTAADPLGRSASHAGEGDAFLIDGAGIIK